MRRLIDPHALRAVSRGLDRAGVVLLAMFCFRTGETDLDAGSMNVNWIIILFLDAIRNNRNHYIFRAPCLR